MTVGCSAQNIRFYSLNNLFLVIIKLYHPLCGCKDQCSFPCTFMFCARTMSSKILCWDEQCFIFLLSFGIVHRFNFQQWKYWYNLLHLLHNVPDFAMANATDFNLAQKWLWLTDIFQNLRCKSFVCFQDLIIMGAPGSDYWTGSIFVYNKTANTFLPYVDGDQVKFGSYLGKRDVSHIFIWLFLLIQLLETCFLWLANWLTGLTVQDKNGKKKLNGL